MWCSDAAADTVTQMYAEEKKTHDHYLSMSSSFSEASRGSGVATSYDILLNLFNEAKKGTQLQEELVRQNRVIMETLVSMRDILDDSSKSDKLNMGVMGEALDSIHKALDRPVVTSSLLSSSLPGTAFQSAPKSSSTAVYYYDSERVSTGPGLISCILHQLICMAADNRITARYPTLPNDHPLSYKELRNIVDIIIRSEASLTSPKPSEPEFQTVAKIVSSHEPGYATRCSVAQISILSASCSRTMSCVEAVRAKLMQCTGILGPRQHICLQSIMYPYASADDVIESNMQQYTDGRIRVLSAGAAKVRMLKPTGRKVYIDSMLKGSTVHSAIIEAQAADSEKK